MFDHAFLDDLPLHASGALDGEPLRVLQEHLNTCEICQMELGAFEEIANRLPLALPKRPLPPLLKENIRARLEKEGLTQSQPVYWKYAIAAAIVAVVVINASLFWNQNLQVIKKEREITNLQKILASQEKEIEWLKDPSVQLSLLTGLAPAPQAKGKMVWNPTAAKGMFYVSYLPPLGHEKSYQLWVIGKKGPVSAGVFDSDQQGSAVVTISRIEGAPEGVIQFAVTIEPRGGVPQPTGSLVLAGKPL